MLKHVEELFRLTKQIHDLCSRVKQEGLLANALRPGLVQLPWIQLPGTMMHRQDFGHFFAKAIYHAIVARDHLPNGRIVDFRDDSPYLWKTGSTAQPIEGHP